VEAQDALIQTVREALSKMPPDYGPYTERADALTALALLRSELTRLRGIEEAAKYLAPDLMDRWHEVGSVLARPDRQEEDET
jgi:hypothetical protein